MTHCCPQETITMGHSPVRIVLDWLQERFNLPALSRSWTEPGSGAEMLQNKITFPALSGHPLSSLHDPASESRLSSASREGFRP
jgi:hypothetical protein